MANASHKHIGAGAQGKGDGTGAMTTIETEDIPDNMVLSNRDKAQHGDQRGLDGQAVQTEQYRDHASNRRVEPEDVMADLEADDVEASDLDLDVAGADTAGGAPDGEMSDKEA